MLNKEKIMSEIQDFVSRTSQMMAAQRALETERPDALFADRYAARLAGPKAIAWAKPKLKEYEDRGTPMVSVRTRFFDDYLMSAASQLGQVVILAAGMDTRAFRLPWPAETCIYELERPEVLETKESILQNTPPKCQRYAIAADFAQPWSSKLLAAGFKSEQPSLWLLEGLLYYLSETEVKELLKTISELSAIGSRLGGDLINTKVVETEKEEFSKYWRYGCDEPEKLFAENGWKASVVQFGDEEAHFGRFTYQFPPREVPNIPRGFLVRATKDRN